MNKRYLALLAAFTFAVALPMLGASSPKGSSLYAFKYPRDGDDPQAPLVADSKGNLYGVTPFGGTSTFCVDGCGTVFELVAPSSPSDPWQKITLYIFAGSSDGAYPSGALTIDANGNLYGTTADGGDLSNPNCTNGSKNIGCGTVFELSPPTGAGGSTWTETVLHEFEWGETDGSYPVAGVVFDGNGNLYGTTELGTLLSNYGIVFELSPGGGGVWTETILYSFTCTTDGGVPEGPLQFDAKGDLYGTTYYCGNNDAGTVFELNPPLGGTGWAFNTIFEFDGDNGGNPNSGLVFDSSGDIFGATFGGGGKNQGVAFELTPPQSGGEWTEQILHYFIGGSDAYPYGFVEDASGNLYGVAGGTANNTCGEIFELSNSANGWNQRILYSFSRKHDTQGCFPQASLIYGKWNALYGTTSRGGSDKVFGLGLGTVFGFLP